MENIEINLGDDTFTMSPFKAPIEPTTSGLGTSSHSILGVKPMAFPTGGLYHLDYVYDMPKQLEAYSKDEVLNKILNEMADEVEGKVKEKRTVSIPVDPAVVDPYDFTVRTYTSTTTTPFTTTIPSSWKIY